MRQVDEDIQANSGQVHGVVVPRLSPKVADSYMVMRGEVPDVEWLTPDRGWTRDIFEGARFEAKAVAKQWLCRELEAA